MQIVSTQRLFMKNSSRNYVRAANGFELEKLRMDRGLYGSLL
jgi:hypothetical protein